MNTVYIVTVSEHYYPAAGCGDWVLVTQDLEVAKTYVDAKSDEWHAAYVVKIDLSTLSYDVVYPES